jgi:hypothetical protein
MHKGYEWLGGKTPYTGFDDEVNDEHPQADVLGQATPVSAAELGTLAATFLASKGEVQEYYAWVLSTMTHEERDKFWGNYRRVRSDVSSRKPTSKASI